MSYIIINTLLLFIISIAFSNFSILIFGFVLSFIPLLFANITHVKKYKKNITTLMCISIVVMLLYVMLVYFLCLKAYGKPYYYGGSDDATFEESAEYLLSRNVFGLREAQGVYIFSMQDSKGYCVLLTWIMRISSYLFGYHTIIPRILNMYILLSISVLMVSLYCRKISSKASTGLFFLLSLFPNSLFISSFVFRDTISVFLLVLLFYIHFKESKNTASMIIRILLSAFILYFAFFVRSSLVIIGLCIIAVSIVFRKQKAYESKEVHKEDIAFIEASKICLIKNKDSHFKKIRKYVLIGACLISLFLVVIFIFGKKINDYITSYDAYRLDDANADGGLSILIFGQPFFPIGFILRFAYIVVSPIPVNLIKVNSFFEGGIITLDFINSLGTVLQIFMLAYFFVSLKKFNKASLCALLCMCAALITFTFRHVLLFYPFLFTGIAVQKSYSSPMKKQLYKVFSASAILLLGCVYILLKAL